MKPIEIVFLLALVALTAAVGAWRLRGWLRRVQMQRRFARGRVGESQAEGLLERSGYRILDDQLQMETGFWVDQQWCPVTVRADFLVERRGRRYVAEVKTGKSATNPASTATRRQLLEYSRVYDTDGLLLVDMESRQLRCIRFDDHPPLGVTSDTNSAWRQGWAWGAVGGVAAGLVLGWIGRGLLTIVTTGMATP